MHGNRDPTLPFGKLRTPPGMRCMQYPLMASMNIWRTCVARLKALLGNMEGVLSKVYDCIAWSNLVDIMGRDYTLFRKALCFSAEYKELR